MDASLTAWLVAARAAHFGACLMIFCACVFEQWITKPALDHSGLSSARCWSPIARSLVWISVIVCAISGLAWFVLVTAQMGDLPIREALKSDVLRDVWNQTQFGALWKLRLLLFSAMILSLAAAPFAACPSRARSILNSLTLLLSAALSATLAWAGHGQTGPQPALHLTADVLHILVTGLWPIGLVPLAVLLIRLRREPAPARTLAFAELIRRFSTLSIASVTVLTLTGIINSWVLVGSFSNLLGTRYGRVLLAKLALFALLIMLGAINLLYVRPRLSPTRTLSSRGHHSILILLQANVAIEIVLATLVMVIVGILGLMPPAME